MKCLATVHTALQWMRIGGNYIKFLCNIGWSTSSPKFCEIWADIALIT